MAAAAVRSDLTYDQRVTYQHDILGVQSQYIRPRHVTDTGSQVILEISGTSFSIPFDETRLIVKYCVKKKATTGDQAGRWINVDHTGDDATLAPVQNVLESLFTQYDISIQNRLVSETTNMFPYIGHMTKLINFSPEAKSTYLALAGWHSDTGSPDTTTTANEGWVQRKNRILNSRVDTVRGVLYSDLTYSLAQIPANTDITLSLTKSDANFFLQGGQENTVYNVEIKDVEMELRKYELSPRLNMSIEKQLASKTGGTVPYTHVAATNHFITTGTSIFNVPRLCQGRVPNKIILALVENDAFIGNVTKSPYNYMKHGVADIQLNIDGVPLPSRPLDVSTSHEAYDNFFRNIGQFGMCVTNGVTFDQFENGHFIYVFNTRPDMDNRMDCFPPAKNGTVALRMTFDAATTKGLVLVCLAEFNHIYNIDRLRNFTSDHALH